MKSALALLFAALVGCSGAASSEPGPDEREDTSEQRRASNDVPVAVTRSDESTPAKDGGSAEDAAPASSCTNGAVACGKPDKTDSGNLYTCVNGAWAKTELCGFGCGTSNGAPACKPNPLAACCAIIKSRPKDNNNFCFAAPGTAQCPMTAAGGYCDPNGDKSYTDGNWVRGYDEFKKYCL